MSKFKKGYCVASVIFAALVIVFTLTVSFPGTVNATAVNPNGTTDGVVTGDDINDLQMGNDGETADAGADINKAFP